MGKIIILDENTSNKIAAGEVIERPASVIKELVENSIDAGASVISVEIKNGGISFIKVTDNGSGIDEDDVEIAFERHGTSKIKNAEDLDSISSLGFRGEALASIAAVSLVELSSRTNDKSHGKYIKIQGGNIKDIRQTGCPIGTTFIIKDLFYNTPARFKFLKKDITEAGYISDIIGRMAIGNPQISFKLVSNNSVVYHSPGNNDLLSAIFSIYGKDTAKDVKEINFKSEMLQIGGFAGKPEIARSNRNFQSIYINGRFVKSKLIASAVDEAYKTFLMKNKFAFIVLNIKVNPLLVDVNVHPTKMEVRFSDEQEIFRGVFHAVTNALLFEPDFKNISLEKNIKDVFKFKPEETLKNDYKQENLNLKSNSLTKKQTSNENINTNNYFLNTPIENYNKNDNMATAKEEIKNYITFEIKPETLTEIKPETLTEIKPETKPEISPEITPSSFMSFVSNERKNEIETEGIIKQNTVLKDEKNSQNEVNDWKDILVNSKVIGQAFSTYILLQYEDQLILIDQHAAHERIKYEYIKDKFNKNEPFSQLLLTPVVVELTNPEINYLESDKEIFEKIGFDFEYFGNNSIIIRSVPDIADLVSVKEIFLEVLDYLINSIKKDFKKVSDEDLFSIACKAAVKANMKLNEIEISELISELTKIENPFTCPHGRPTVTKITKHEIEKIFKRIL